ncbi:deoxynucleoside triphosphate triphosphohydrolase SAMHD1-like isoform X2 [Oculina patagonica]
MDEKEGSTSSSDVQREYESANSPKEDHSSQTSSSTNLNPQAPEMTTTDAAEITTTDAPEATTIDTPEVPTTDAPEVTPTDGDDNSLGQNFKVFNDSVHGHIELPLLCVKIIDTPQFQRLRNIKQLGGCYFVYPSASHNRFEHSIGTSYLAGKLVKKLQKRQPDLGITKEDILCVQIAGLCHDLGHGPFSHMFDAQFIPQAKPGCEWKHENASIHMFDHMIVENPDLRSSFEHEKLNESDLIFIKGLIEGKERKESPGTGRGLEKSFLYEIVANKRTGIDVDKFDYFARDCHGLGINNSFDHKRYIKFARVIFVEEGKPQICLRDKEIYNIYGLFQTRNSLHRGAYKHKTCIIIEKMITEAFLKADESSLMNVFQGKNEKLSISQSIGDMKAYTRLTDHVYYLILNFADDDLKNVPEEKQRLMKEARDILMRVEKRDLYKCIGQTILMVQREKGTIPNIREEIAGGDHLEQEDFVVDIVKFNYGMGDKNPIDELRFYGKRAPDKAIKIRKEEVSEMLPKTFAEQEMRVYFKKVDDDDLLKKAEECFKQWCKNQEDCTPPKGGDGLAEMTPMKPSPEQGPDVQKCQMSQSVKRSLSYS